MILKSALVALLSALSFPAAAIAQDASVGIVGEQKAEAPPPPAAGAVSLFTRGTCGTAANSHLCATMTAGDPKGRTAALAVSAPKGATVMVTWTGTVFCEGRYQAVELAFANALQWEILVNMQLQAGRLSPVALNDEGSTTVGHRDLRSSSEGPINVSMSTFHLYPVSLSRTFVKRAGGSENYFVALEAEFRVSLGAVCNINGGAMTAVVVR